MRHFTHDTGTGRKFVVVEVRGAELRVMQGNSDGTTRRTVKALKNEAEARLASQRMANELLARGFLEQVSDSSIVVPGQPSTVPRSPVLVARGVKPTARRAKPTEVLDFDALVEVADGAAEGGEALLPRLTTMPESAPKPKRKQRAGACGPGRTAAAGDPLDKRVIAGVVALGLALVAGVVYLGHDTFFQPATIIGSWEGSRTEHEIGKSSRHTEYRLILDAQWHAALTLRGKFTSVGTYAIQGDRLKLTFRDEDGAVIESCYRFQLGHSTLDLFDPTSGTKVVELIRFRDQPAAVALAKAPQAPGGLGEAPAAPNAGSLMVGSNQNSHEPASELAPVHAAHELDARKAAKGYGDYQESAPALFPGSTLDEGRVATFTAARTGLFGARVQGIRVTLLTSDRRISVLCEAPASQFARYKPTFLAIARSLAR